MWEGLSHMLVGGAVKCGTLEIAWCCHILGRPRLCPLAARWDFDSNTGGCWDESRGGGREREREERRGRTRCYGEVTRRSPPGGGDTSEPRDSRPRWFKTLVYWPTLVLFSVCSDLFCVLEMLRSLKIKLNSPKLALLFGRLYQTSAVKYRQRIRHLQKKEKL